MEGGGGGGGKKRGGKKKGGGGGGGGGEAKNRVKQKNWGAKWAEWWTGANARRVASLADFSCPFGYFLRLFSPLRSLVPGCACSWEKANQIN